MPNKEVTVVEYDVNAAVAQIAKLEQRIEELEKKTRRSFGKAGAAVEGFEKGIKGLSPRAGTLVEQFRKLTAGVTPFGVAIGVATGSIVGLAKEVLDLPASFRSASEQLDAMTASFNRIAEVARSGIKLETTVETQDVKEQLKALTLRRANLQEERAALQEQKGILKARLDAQKEFLKQSDRLRDKRFNRSLEGQDPQRQLDRLLTRASALRQRGNAGDFERAERLIDDALEVANKSGDFRDQSRVIAEEGRLLQAIERKVVADEKGAAVAAKTGQQRIADLEAEIRLLEQREQINKADTKRVAVDSTRKQVGLDDKADAGAQREALLDRERALQTAFAAANRQRNFGGGFFDKLRGGLNQVTGTDVAGQEREFRRAQESGARAFLGLKKGTVEGDKEALKNLHEMETILGRLEARGVTGSLKFDIKNLKQAGEEMRNVVDADERFRKAGGGDEFRQGSVNREAERYAEHLERAAEASKQIRLPSLNVPASPAPRAAPVQGAAPAAAGAAAAQTINVTANIKGGLFDAETVRAITDIFNREIRRGTQRPPQQTA